MKQSFREESYWDSEFDIYQEYKSNSQSDSNMSVNPNSNQGNREGSDKFSLDKQRMNTHNQRKSKNVSQVIIANNWDSQNSQLGQLFKRPSITMNWEKFKKKSVAKKETIKFRKQIESWFVHK